MKPDICIAIPTYNRGAILVDTIKDALRQSHQNIEVLVVDQTKLVDPVVLAAIHAIGDPRLRYYQADPPSLPAARNFALHYAKAPVVLFIDDDVELTIDLVKYALKTLAEKPDVAAVAGRVLQKDFPIKKEVLRFDEYGVSNGVFTATDAAYTNTFPGGNHAIRVDEALKVGGYDTRFYGNAFREESDMAARLIKDGKKIYFEPRMELLHLAAHFGGVESRVKGHIYDNKMFYRNELFFTLRVVAPGKRLTALKRKYTEYCRSAGRRRLPQRSLYFAAGLLAAQWRIWFGRQIITAERVQPSNGKAN